MLLLPGLLLLAALANQLMGRTAYAGRTYLYLLYMSSAAGAIWLGWQTGWQSGAKGDKTRNLSTIDLVAWAVLLAATANAVIGFAQYLGLSLPTWLAVRLPTGGRVFGNLRQANLFSLLLVLGIICAAMLFAQRQKSWKLDGFAILLGAACALSLSRTGAVMIWLVCIGAWAGKGLSLPSRRFVAVATISHALAWGLYSALSTMSWKVYAPTSTIQLVPGQGNFSSFRQEIWMGMLQVAQSNFWTGVGTGGAGHAYFLQDVQGRFDVNMQNAHNLALQIFVEQGGPFVIAWLGILIYVIWAVRKAWFDPIGRGLFLLLLAFAVHSTLEYPLWYLYFLLPCAFFLGALCSLAASPTDSAIQEANPANFKRLLIGGAAAAVLLIGVAWDYRKILPVFKGSSAQALSHLEEGYKTLLFTYCVDYAAVANVAVTPENAATYYRLTKRLHTAVIQPFTVLNLAMASQMIGKTDEAALYLRRLQEISPTAIEEIWAKLSVPEQEVLAPAIARMETLDSGSSKRK
ncbi:Wzy polymerase domain-containing protein [Variovorax sp. VNK109]|uniref:PglL family O-oligosaccharyltransferase n=1 Tax=Variovorax sp. VNK109 TaxID=3400919 RepID=UPI003C02B8C0